MSAQSGAGERKHIPFDKIIRQGEDDADEHAFLEDANAAVPGG